MRALRNKRKIAGELVGKYSNYSAVIQGVLDLNLFSGYLHHCNEPPQKRPDMTQGKIDLRNESGRPMKVKVVGEVSEK